MTVMPSAALIAANRLTAVLLRTLAAACWTCGTAAFLGSALSLVSHTTGGAAFAPLLFAAHAHTLPSAIAVIALEGFVPALALALVLMLARFALRSVLLRDTEAAWGIVESSAETLLSIAGHPVLAVRVTRETPAGRVIASARQRFAQGEGLRRGDAVRIAVSRLDPTCCRILAVVARAAFSDADAPLRGAARCSDTVDALSPTARAKPVVPHPERLRQSGDRRRARLFSNDAQRSRGAFLRDARNGPRLPS